MAEIVSNRDIILAMCGQLSDRPEQSTTDHLLHNMIKAEHLGQIL